MEIFANMSQWPQAPRSRTPRVIKALAAAVLLLGAMSAVQPATLGAGSLVKAATQSIVAARRARPLDLAGPRVPLALVHSQAARLDAARAPSGGQFSAVEVRGANDAAGRSPGGAPLALHWQTSPEIVRVARQIRHSGLPIVRLWQSGPNLVAIGLNPHGVPGIYFTQKVPD